jgi:glutamate racemase
MLGLYDSGIGGLSILKEIKKLNPSLDIIYLADNKNLPLGEKSLDEIQKIVQSGVEKLFELGCHLVILACNTATVNTIRYLQQVWLPESKWAQTHQVLGIGQPLLEILEDRKVDLISNQGVIMATPATYKSGFYQSEVKQRDYTNLPVLPCLGLANSIETFNDLEIYNNLENLFTQSKLDLNKLKFIVLACTHYIWAKDQIKKVFGGDIEIIDSGFEIALKLQKYLLKHPKFNSSNSNLNFYSTKPDLDYKYNEVLKSKLGIDGVFKQI